MPYSDLYNVAPITLDGDNPTLKFEWGGAATGKDFTHNLVLSIGAINYTFSDFVYSSANNGQTIIPLSESQVTALLGATSNTPSGTATYRLNTYLKGAGLMGTSTKTGLLNTTPSISSPTFEGFTLSDTNTSTAALGGYIQTISSLSAAFTGATAKNGATIAKFIISAAGKTEESATTPVNFGNITSAGEILVTATVQDSRGYTASLTQTITVVPYTPIKLNSYTFRRENNVGTTVQLIFSGTYSPLNIGGVDRNSFQGATRQLREMGGSYSAETAISDVVSGDGSFSYSNLTWGTLLEDTTYQILLKVSDMFSSDTVTLTLPKGMPRIRITKYSVGIGVTNPQGALDVFGIIWQNSLPVMGTVLSEMNDSIDLNSMTIQGLYYKTIGTGTTANHYPAATKGILEVFTNIDASVIMQRFTDVTNLNVYIRSYTSSAWASWKQI